MDEILNYVNTHGAQIAAILLPLLVAFVKSELMALNKTSAANGIAHYFKLANHALAIAATVEQPEVQAAAAQIADVVQEIAPEAPQEVAPNA